MALRTAVGLRVGALQNAVGLGAGHGSGIAANQVGAAVQGSRMVRNVTLLAQVRLPDLQQRRVVRAVRRMTIRASVGDRFVFPQEWSALLGMAGVAGIID